MGTDLSPEQVRAARALLAWSQADLAKEAKVGVSTIADFERKARAPVANNAQAIRAALEAQGLQFIADGVVGKGQIPVPPPQSKAGKIMKWIDATSLDQWADRRDAQSCMAELIRRLIYAQVGPGATVHFPSDESVQFSGWDGTCTSTTSTEFIPEGVSGWEIGTTGRSIAKKANDDLSNRLANPDGLDPTQTTFVFVTPRRFPKKKTWLANKRTEGAWRDVWVIDADDLVHWLELAPVVAQWLAVRIGRRPDGLQNLEEVWEEWSLATAPLMPPGVILVDRGEQAAEIHKWTMDGPSLLSLQAESPQEAIAFLYACLHEFPEDYRLAFLSRTVVATSQDMARQLVGIGTPLIVVMSDPEPGLARRLSESGHHIFAAYGPEVAPVAGTICLPRPWTHNLQAELIAAGLAEEKAHQYARACGRSITALRRLMPSAAIPRPSWATRTPPGLLAAMLAGSWVESSQVDRRIVSDIAGCSYEELEEVLTPLTMTLDGPLRHVGGIWKVVSLRDLWGLVASQLTPTMLRRFSTAFQEVLGARNPRFEAGSKDNWFEQPDQYGPEASSPLRRGLAEALIALGVYPQVASGISEATQFADLAIKRLLEDADAHLWWSLSGDFRRLAEASPRAFLEAVHGALEGENPPLMAVFRSEDGPLSPREYLAELLWALEMLARSEDYLMPAALALARLAELDPGGRMANRPKGSLREIFVCWAPQTSATLDQRLKVVDAVLRHYPAVGWNLLLGLAPHHHDVMTPTPHPDWRDFSPVGEEDISFQALGRAYRAIGKRLLQHVGADAGRWKALLELWMSFEPSWRDEAADRLKSAVQEITDSEAMESIRDDIRKLLHHHREFPDADWAKPEEELAPLQAIFDSMEPRSAEERHRWLFKPGARVLRHGRTYEEWNEELRAIRKEAAVELLTELTSEGLIRFAGTVKHAFDLGVAIGETGAPDEFKAELLRLGLGADEVPAFQLAGGILGQMHVANGDVFVEELWVRAVKEGWGEKAELHIVGVLPAVPETWARVETRSSTLHQAYWEKLNVYRIAKDADFAQVVDRLIKVGRGGAAVELLGSRIEENPPKEVLVRALKAAVKADHISNSNDAVMFTHYLAEIFNHLESDPEANLNELASLEWAYFQVMRYSERPPKALYRALAESPEFFVELIKCLYRPAEDSGIQEPPPENPEMASQVASQAYGVLKEWNHIPGADDSGVIDGVALEAWVTKARKLCQEAGRLEVGDSQIGQMFAAARRETGELWPPQAVRDLIQIVRSRALERGFEVGVYNSRGVVWRSPFDGGMQERDLATSYRRSAEAMRFDHPRVAACLDRIADSYDRDALHHDQDAEHRDWM